MIEALKIDVQGVPVDMTVVAYPVGRGEYTTMMIAYPSMIDDKDARVAQALDFSAAAITKRYVLKDPRAFDRTAPTSSATTFYDDRKAPSAAAAPPPPPPPPPAAPTQQAGKTCERRPIWGFRVSYWCQPSGICNDRVIKGYETVCE